MSPQDACDTLAVDICPEDSVSCDCSWHENARQARAHNAALEAEDRLEAGRACQDACDDAATKVVLAAANLVRGLEAGMAPGAALRFSGLKERLAEHEAADRARGEYVAGVLAGVA